MAFDHENARPGDRVVYSVSNPHPLFGKDPNILNELGHTEYPKWVEHPTQKFIDKNGKETEFPLRVLVDSPMEESQLLGTKKSKKGEDWTGK